jgi:putative phosphoesterase
MTRIGLIADTHSFLDENVFKHFEQCDEIWHAGDFGTIAIAHQLATFRPLKAVYGNIDSSDVRSVYPEDNFFQCEDVKVFMTHIGGYPPKYNSRVKPLLQEKKPGLFIAGHSHILKVMYDDKLQCLHINPGAAGNAGWHNVRTIITLVIDGSDMKDCNVIELGRRGLS